MAFESSNTSINNYKYNIDSPSPPPIAMKPNNNFRSTADSDYITPSCFIRPEEKVDEGQHNSASSATFHAGQIRVGEVEEGTQTGEFAVAGDHREERGLEEWRRILIGQQFLFVPGEEKERRAFRPKNGAVCFLYFLFLPLPSFQFRVGLVEGLGDNADDDGCKDSNARELEVFGV